jgi:hypothetical protein
MTKLERGNGAEALRRSPRISPAHFIIHQPLTAYYDVIAPILWLDFKRARLLHDRREFRMLF